MRAELAHIFQDENRFATKGAHLNLKRAEKARAAIAKLPGIDLRS
jgi:protein regulator of cytokinesis 1